MITYFLLQNIGYVCLWCCAPPPIHDGPSPDETDGNHSQSSGTCDSFLHSVWHNHPITSKHGAIMWYENKLNSMFHIFLRFRNYERLCFLCLPTQSINVLDVNFERALCMHLIDLRTGVRTRRTWTAQKESVASARMLQEPVSEG